MIFSETEKRQKTLKTLDIIGFMKYNETKRIGEKNYGRSRIIWRLAFGATTLLIPSHKNHNENHNFWRNR